MKVFPFIVNGEDRFGGQEQSMEHSETMAARGKGARHLRDVCKVIVGKVMKSRLIFDSAKSGLLLSEVPKRRLPRTCGPRRLARPRTSPFHGGNTGSNPVGDANKIKNFRKITAFLYGPIWSSYDEAVFFMTIFTSLLWASLFCGLTACI
jgi:hypothetical protein